MPLLLIGVILFAVVIYARREKKWQRNLKKVSPDLARRDRRDRRLQWTMFGLFIVVTVVIGLWNIMKSVIGTNNGVGIRQQLTNKYAQAVGVTNATAPTTTTGDPKKKIAVYLASDCDHVATVLSQASHDRGNLRNLSEDLSMIQTITNGYNENPVLNQTPWWLSYYSSANLVDQFDNVMMNLSKASHGMNLIIGNRLEAQNSETAISQSISEFNKAQSEFETFQSELVSVMNQPDRALNSVPISQTPSSQTTQTPLSQTLNQVKQSFLHSMPTTTPNGQGDDLEYYVDVWTGHQSDYYSNTLPGTFTVTLSDENKQLYLVNWTIPIAPENGDLSSSSAQLEFQFSESDHGITPISSDAKKFNNDLVSGAIS